MFYKSCDYFWKKKKIINICHILNFIKYKFFFYNIHAIRELIKHQLVSKEKLIQSYFFFVSEISWTLLKQIWSSGHKMDINRCQSVQFNMEIL